jgi:GntR family transcriptional regulator
MEPIIIIDEHSKEPIYRQIVEQVRRHIATGTLVAGNELPSLRQLATDLRIHLNTVALAYRELERQGIIRLRQGSKATILPVDRSTLVVDPEILNQLRAQLERIRTEAVLNGVSMDELRDLANHVFIDFDLQ